MRKIVCIFLISFVLASCTNGLTSDDVSRKAVEYLQCYGEDAFIRYLGTDRETCKELHKVLFEQQTDKCFNDFFDADLDNEEIAHFAYRCLSLWLDRQYLDLAKEHTIYLKTITN